MSTAASTFVLWGDLTCPYSQRVQIALREKNVPFVDQFVNLDDQESPARGELCELFRACHPNPDKKPLIPVLQHKGAYAHTGDKGVLVIESDIILNYINEEYLTSPSLIPESACDSMHVRMLVHLFMSELTPFVRKIILGNTAELLNEAVEFLDQGCAIVESCLAKAHYTYPEGTSEYGFLLNSKFSMAECILAPHIQRICLLSHKEIRPQLTALLVKKAGLSSDETVVHNLSDMDESPMLLYLRVRFPRFFQWTQSVLARPSAIDSFHRPEVIEVIGRIKKAWSEE